MSASRHGCPWEAAEVERLRAFAVEGFTRAEAARMLDRTTESVASKAKEQGVAWRSTSALPQPDGSSRAILHYGDDGTPQAFVAHLAQRGVRGTARYYGLTRRTIGEMKKRALGPLQDLPRRGLRKGFA